MTFCIHRPIYDIISGIGIGTRYRYCCAPGIVASGIVVLDGIILDLV